MKKDRVVGGISAVMGFIFLYFTMRIPDSNMIGDPGPRVFPLIGSGIFIVCGIGLLIKKPEKTTETFMTFQQWKNLIVMIGVMFLYFLALRYLGFLVPTVVMLYVSSTLFQGSIRVAWWKKVVFAVLITAILYCVFTRILGVVMPGGALGL